MAKITCEQQNKFPSLKDLHVGDFFRFKYHGYDDTVPGYTHDVFLKTETHYVNLCNGSQENICYWHVLVEIFPPGSKITIVVDDNV